MLTSMILTEKREEILSDFNKKLVTINGLNVLEFSIFLVSKNEKKCLKYPHL